MEMTESCLYTVISLECEAVQVLSNKKVGMNTDADAPIHPYSYYLCFYCQLSMSQNDRSE